MGGSGASAAYSSALVRGTLAGKLRNHDCLRPRPWSAFTFLMGVAPLQAEQHIEPEGNQRVATSRETVGKPARRSGGGPDVTKPTVEPIKLRKDVTKTRKDGASTSKEKERTNR